MVRRIRVRQLAATTLSVTLALALNAVFTRSALAASGKETVEKLIILFKSWDTGATPKEVFSEAATYIDYGSMAEQALGSDEWAKIKPADKTSFTTALRQLVEQRYYPRWHKLFSKGTLIYGKESTAGGGGALNSVLKVNKKSQDVIWKFGRSNPPRVVSLKVEDKDLLQHLHERISPRLTRSGFASLLSWMQNRAAKEMDAN